MQSAAQPQRAVPRECSGSRLVSSLRGAGLGLLLLTHAASAATHVTPLTSSGAARLPLDGAGSAVERIVKVADLDISSDAPQGYTLTITSGTLGKGDGQTPISFQVVTVGEGAPPPSAAAFTTPAGTPYVYTTGASGAHTRQLYIRYVSAALQDPGAYAASIAVSVVDN